MFVVKGVLSRALQVSTQPRLLLSSSCSHHQMSSKSWRSLTSSRASPRRQQQQGLQPPFSLSLRVVQQPIFILRRERALIRFSQLPRVSVLLTFFALQHFSLTLHVQRLGELHQQCALFQYALLR